MDRDVFFTIAADPIRGCPAADDAVAPAPTLLP